MPKHSSAGPESLGPWLRANALFSAVSGTAIAVTSGALPKLLGVGGATLYLLLGVALVLYGGRLWMLSRHEVGRFEGWAIVGGDVLWVVGSLGLLAAGILTPPGVWIVGLVAVVIAVFAAGQGRALVRSSRARPPARRALE